MDCPILCYGEIDLDYYLAIDDFPGLDAWSTVQTEFHNVGGAAANTAIWLANWGVPVRLMGHELGNDSYGELVRRQLNNYPLIDTRYIYFREKHSTPRCQCLVTPDGERSFIIHWPDQMRITPLETDMLYDTKWLSLDTSGPLPPRVEAAKLAKTHHVSVLANDVYSIDHPLVGLADIIVLSASIFHRTHSNQSLQEFADNLRHVGRCDVICTDGKHPVKAFLISGDEVTIHPPQVPVVDTTGSGDIFRAGLLYGLVSGFTVKQSLKWAVAAGSAKAGLAGTTANLALISTLQELILQMDQKAIS